jgi:ribosomal protein S18 acetylase RimI-like enzyme
MIDYRDAVPGDGPAITDLARIVWVATFGHSASPDDVALYLEQSFGAGGTLLRDLADPRFRFRLATDDGRVVGYAKVGPPFFTHEVETKGAVQLHQLYVDTSHHGTGVAAELMRWTIALGRAQDADALLLTVWEDNPRAQRFYARHGFVHVADYAFQTGTQVDRDLILRLPL